MLSSIWEWITADPLRSLSILGNIVLGVIIFLQWRERNRLRRIEEDREDRQEKKRQSASLVADFRKSGGSYRLHITNHGYAPAKDVEVFADGEPVLYQRGFPESSTKQNPIDVIAPRGSYNYLYAASKDTPGTLTIRLCWDDQAGGGEWESTLSVHS